MNSQLAFLMGIILMVVSSICMAGGCIFALAGDYSRSLACVVTVTVTVIAAFAFILLEERRGR